MLQTITRAISGAALIAIRFYQRYLSPLLPPSCRFQPTCSQYTYQAIERFGIWRGGWLGVRRLCRCNPFHPCGCDVVPEYWGQKVPFLPDRPVRRRAVRPASTAPEAEAVVAGEAVAATDETIVPDGSAASDGNNVERTNDGKS